MTVINILDAIWKKQISYLETYFAIHHTWPTKETVYPPGNALGAWCATQQENFHAKKLSSIQILCLFKLQFPFMSTTQKWDLQKELLCQYLDKNQGVFPTIKTQYPPGNFLGEWCHTQRNLFHKNMLSVENKNALKAIKFQFE